MKIYLAGPLFTTAERNFNLALARRLRMLGHVVFLPQENEQRHTTADAIFIKDVNGIDWSEVVVACMDGPDPDSGTAWECGYAFGGKLVILFRTDIRSEEPLGPFNLMLHAAANLSLDCRWMGVDEIADEIDSALLSFSP